MWYRRTWADHDVAQAQIAIFVPQAEASAKSLLLSHPGCTSALDDLSLRSLEQRDEIFESNVEVFAMFDLGRFFLGLKKAVKGGHERSADVVALQPNECPSICNSLNGRA